MGILDGIVEWIAEQVMAGLDLVTTSVLGALGCDMTAFLRYFPAAETMYHVFVALSIGIILLIICADSLFSKKIITKNKTIETVSVFPISRKIKAKNIGNAHSVIMANRVSKTIVYVLSFQKSFSPI